MDQCALVDLSIINLFVNFPLKSLIGAIISNMKGPFPFEFEEFNYSKSFPIWNCQLSKFSYSNFSHFVQPTHFPPTALSDTLFTLNQAATETAKMVVQVKHFICKTYFAMFSSSFFAEKWNKDFIMWRVFYKLFSIGSKMGHFYLIFKMNIFFVLKEKGRNLWTKIN